MKEPNKKLTSVSNKKTKTGRKAEYLFIERFCTFQSIILCSLHLIYHKILSKLNFEHSDGELDIFPSDISF